MPARSAGQQRQFDKQEVLDRAMRIFWRKGFIGVSGIAYHLNRTFAVVSCEIFTRGS